MASGGEPLSQSPNADLSRWRLVLGRYAQDQMPAQMSGREARMEQVLDYLYSREYGGRGVRDRTQPGSLDASQLTVPTWLAEVRELFPRDTVEVIEKHALDRYGMTELLTDEETLKKLEPSTELLKVLLTFRGHLHGSVLDEARRIIRHVVEEIKQKLAADVRRMLAGKLNCFQRSAVKVSQNFNWRGTIRANLKNYDRERGHIIPQDLHFYSRVQCHLPWRIVLCIDQSGSMADSVIHSAVMAGILTGLPLLNVRLVVFDTSVVDLSEYVDDPVEVLMNVQLGGGTDIGQALAYCETLVEIPHRTIIVLVSDFCEGATPARLLAVCRRLREAGVRLLGLASLDEVANPAYDRGMADQLAAQ